MQDDFTGLLMSYIFSYAIINELLITYLLYHKFFIFSSKRKALGQLTAYLLLLGIGYLLPSHIRVNNRFIFQSTSDLDTVSWSIRTSPHPLATYPTRIRIGNFSAISEDKILHSPQNT